MNDLRHENERLERLTPNACWMPTAFDRPESSLREAWDEFAELARPELNRPLPRGLLQAVERRVQTQRCRRRGWIAAVSSCILGLLMLEGTATWRLARMAPRVDLVTNEPAPRVGLSTEGGARNRESDSVIREQVENWLADSSTAGETQATSPLEWQDRLDGWIGSVNGEVAGLTVDAPFATADIDAVAWRVEMLKASMVEQTL